MALKRKVSFREQVNNFVPAKWDLASNNWANFLFQAYCDMDLPTTKVGHWHAPVMEHEVGVEDQSLLEGQ